MIYVFLLYIYIFLLIIVMVYELRRVVFLSEIDVRLIILRIVVVIKR